MSTATTPAMPAEKPQLSQPARIINTIIDPVKTFTDLNRGTAWWMAFLLTALMGYGMVAAVATQIGWEQVSENQMKLNPSQYERMEKMPPEQRAQAERMGIAVTKGISFGFPVMSLIGIFLVGAVLMATFNFGFGAEVSFAKAIAVVAYAGLVGSVKALLVALTLFAGASPEFFTFQNPLASNLGYFVDMNEHRVLYALGSSLDVFTIWYVILLGIGFSCVSKVKRGTAVGVALGWWAVIVLVGAGFAAMM